MSDDKSLSGIGISWKDATIRHLEKELAEARDRVEYLETLEAVKILQENIRLKAALNNNGWVSVETLPETDAVVDVWIKSTESEEYGKRLTNVSFVNGEFKPRLEMPIQYVSHYSPLPQPPTTDKEPEL